MTIKEVSERTGVSIDNLRYYERIGVIPPIPRTSSGIREYDERAIHWVEFVLKFKKAGASLETIIEYIRLAHSGNASQESRRELLVELKEQLETRMRELQECLDVTNFKIENYYNMCDLVTNEMIEEWRQSKSED